MLFTSTFIPVPRLAFLQRIQNSTEPLQVTRGQRDARVRPPAAHRDADVRLLLRHQHLLHHRLRHLVNAPARALPAHRLDRRLEVDAHQVHGHGAAARRQARRALRRPRARGGGEGHHRRRGRRRPQRFPRHRRPLQAIRGPLRADGPRAAAVRVVRGGALPRVAAHGAHVERSGPRAAPGRPPHRQRAQRAALLLPRWRAVRALLPLLP